MGASQESLSPVGGGKALGAQQVLAFAASLPPRLSYARQPGRGQTLAPEGDPVPVRRDLGPALGAAFHQIARNSSRFLHDHSATFINDVPTTRRKAGEGPVVLLRQPPLPELLLLRRLRQTVSSAPSSPVWFLWRASVSSAPPASCWYPMSSLMLHTRLRLPGTGRGRQAAEASPGSGPALREELPGCRPSFTSCCPPRPAAAAMQTLGVQGFRLLHRVQAVEGSSSAPTILGPASPRWTPRVVGAHPPRASGRSEQVGTAAAQRSICPEVRAWAPLRCPSFAGLQPPTEVLLAGPGTFWCLVSDSSRAQLKSPLLSSSLPGGSRGLTTSGPALSPPARPPPSPTAVETPTLVLQGPGQAVWGPQAMPLKHTETYAPVNQQPGSKHTWDHRVASTA